MRFDLWVESCYIYTSAVMIKEIYDVKGQCLTCNHLVYFFCPLWWVDFLFFSFPVLNVNYPLWWIDDYT